MNEMIDLVDLTWEQKEQVLRELFARINGTKLNKPKNDSFEHGKTQKSLALTRSSNNKESDVSDFDDNNLSPNFNNYIDSKNNSSAKKKSL
jgi:hypothetical protein